LKLVIELCVIDFFGCGPMHANGCWMAGTYTSPGHQIHPGGPTVWHLYLLTRSIRTRPITILHWPASATNQRPSSPTKHALRDSLQTWPNPRLRQWERVQTTQKWWWNTTLPDHEAKDYLMGVTRSNSCILSRRGTIPTDKRTDPAHLLGYVGSAATVPPPTICSSAAGGEIHLYMVPATNMSLPSSWQSQVISK